MLITIYGVLTARETCADLLYFWGPKGQRFHYAGKIDTYFLSFPHYYLMHPDYPPLLPLLYAWGSLAAHKFSWWGALLLTPIFLLATIAAFRGLIAEALGKERATQFALLLTAILGYGYAVGMVGGAGEPPLLLFETIVLAALTFGKDRSAYILAAIALVGCVLTKVEGSAFAAVVLIAFVITRRRIAAAAAVAAPALLLIGLWIAMMKKYVMLDAYSVGRKETHFELIPRVTSLTLKQASYALFYIPWVASLAPIVTGRNWRRAALPLLTGLGVFAYTIYFYLHEADPTWWIASSAERVLLTALMAFVVASAAASE